MQALGVTFLTGIFFVLLFGYVLNLVALFHLDSVGGEMVLRTIGIFAAPIGVFMGFFI
jgi:hypothetical protein